MGYSWTGAHPATKLLSLHRCEGVPVWLGESPIVGLAWFYIPYHQTSNIRCTLVCNKIVDHSDVLGASPLGAAPTTSSFLTTHLASMDWAETTARPDEKHLSVGIWCTLYLRFDSTSATKIGLRLHLPVYPSLAPTKYHEMLEFDRNL